MASVCCFLLISLWILQAQAETTRLRDWTNGQEFTRCLKAFDWVRVTADDEVAILDRDPETGCCVAGWIPGTQPLVRRKQTFDGTYPILYTYGQITCGWRNGTYGVVGQKPTKIGGQCDYGTCYIIHQNQSCANGKLPHLSGCCPQDDYGVPFVTNCRRGYFFEDINGIKEDDLHLHLTCRHTTGPGWKNATGHAVPCEIDYNIEACYTRSTEEYTGAGDYGGTLTPNDDVIDGMLQPQNLYGARWCPVATTTTTTTTSANMTAPAIEDVHDLESNYSNCTNCSDRNVLLFDVVTSNTTTTVTYNSTTTTTAFTTTSNTSTTTTSTSTSTNTTTTSGLAGYVMGHLVLSADDPVAFASSSILPNVMQQFIADLAGPFVITSMVEVKLAPQTSDLFESTGGRRLIGLVDVHFKITVPVLYDSSGALYLGPELIEKHFVGLDLLSVSHSLTSRVLAEGQSDLGITLYVQTVSVSTALHTTALTSTTQTFTCPKSQLCFSQTCDECDKMDDQEKVNCQKRLAEDGHCTCSCFKEFRNMTTSGPPTKGVTDAATIRCSSAMVIGFIATVIVRLHGSSG